MSAYFKALPAFSQIAAAANLRPATSSAPVKNLATAVKGAIFNPGPAVSAQYNPSSGQLWVSGTNQDDQIRVVESAGRIRVEVYQANPYKYQVGNPAAPRSAYLPITIQTSGGPVSFIDAAAVKQVQVYGTGGNDTLTFEHATLGMDPREAAERQRSNEAARRPHQLEVEMFGGGGHDQLNVASATGSVPIAINLYGEGGNDTLRGDLGHERLDGGLDNDTLLGGAGNDTLFGGGGHDDLQGEYDEWGLGRNELHGGSGNDTLTGGAGNDSLYGDADHDKLYGIGGRDYFDGAEGNDTLHGGRRDDNANDTMRGGSGSDLFFIPYGTSLDSKTLVDFNSNEDKAGCSRGCPRWRPVDSMSGYGNTGVPSPDGPEAPKGGGFPW